MKILELAPYVFVAGHPQGERNTSGLAYMIRSICDMVATENEVHVLTQSIITKEYKVGNWLLLKRNFFTIFSNLKIKYIYLAFKLNQKDGFSNFIRRLIYCISAGQAENYIKKWNPDIVHIHTIGFYSIPFFVACANCGVPVLTTLHGLLSFNNIVPVSQTSRLIERVFLKMCIENNYALTFISSGMKQKVKQEYNSECPNIKVIPNCYRPVPYKQHASKENNIKRIICVGSLYPLKNQIQVIRVLPEVQKILSYKYKVVLDIFGDGVSKNEWMTYCKDNGISGVVFHGRKSQEEIFSALSVSDVLVFPSIEEGFGIPIIEAYSCGTPVVTFKDLDASLDISCSDCCIFAENRTDGALVGAIVNALNKKWDSPKITNFAKQFSIKETANKYCRVLKEDITPIKYEHLKEVINVCKS